MLAASAHLTAGHRGYLGGVGSASVLGHLRASAGVEQIADSGALRPRGPRVVGTRSGLLLTPLTPRARVRRAPSYGVEVAQRVQVAVDCQDATRLARFWAGVLGYRILGAPGGFESWEAYSRTQAQLSGETWCKIVDPDGLGPSLLFHTVPEPKTVKNRIHLDVRAPTGVGDRRRDIDEFVDRILDLGGCMRQAVTDDAGYFVVMEDPEGNEFCVGAGSS